MIAPGRLRRVTVGPILGGLTLGSSIFEGFKLKAQKGKIESEILRQEIKKLITVRWKGR